MKTVCVLIVSCPSIDHVTLCELPHLPNTLIIIMDTSIQCFTIIISQVHITPQTSVGLYSPPK